MLLAQPIRCLVLMSPYSFGIGTMHRIDLSDFRSILSDFGSIRLSVSDRLMAHGSWMD